MLSCGRSASLVVGAMGGPCGTSRFWSAATAAVFAVVATGLIGGNHARFIVETGGLKIEFPVDAREKFDMALANFGKPKYGGRITGKIVYVQNDYLDTPVDCSPPCNYGCQSFEDASPKYSLKDSNDVYIMIVDRGPYETGLTPCTFVQKTWNAQNAGASAIVVVNHREELLTPDAPNDESAAEYISNITIPSVFVKKSTGERLKKLLLQDKNEGKNVVISLDWTDILPRQAQVEWEFWMDNNDICGYVCDAQRKFIKDFAPYGDKLEMGNYSQFTPHYLVWSCPLAYRGNSQCTSQCIHNGRYCAPDPDDDLNKGYQGRDVMLENLRQLCLHKIAVQSGKSWVWWDYASRFWDECQISTGNYGQACAEKVFRDIHGPELLEGNGLWEWRKCIDYDHVDDDVDNPMFDAEEKSQKGGGTVGSVTIIPTVRINGDQYRGSLTASEVMRAICSGFPLGSEPHTCNMEWVSENECKAGDVGFAECHNSTNTLAGRTTCKNTFAGWECECAPGFMSVMQNNGSLECLDINECASTNIVMSRPDCACRRCACHNEFGGFHCETDIPDECEYGYGGCWHSIIDGQMYSACVDMIDEYKALAIEGRATPGTRLFKCECPACFQPTEDGGCEPKCDLKYCNTEKGVCEVGSIGTTSGSSKVAGVTPGVLAGVITGVVFVALLAGYYVYRRLRKDVHSELDYFVTHYMPLADEKHDDVLNAQPIGPDDDGAVRDSAHNRMQQKHISDV